MPRHDRAYGRWHSSKAKKGGKRRVRSREKPTKMSKYRAKQRPEGGA